MASVKSGGNMITWHFLSLPMAEVQLLSTNKKRKITIYGKSSEIFYPTITNPTHGFKCCLASASEVSSIARNETTHAVKNSYSQLLFQCRLKCYKAF